MQPPLERDKLLPHYFHKVNKIKVTIGHHIMHDMLLFIDFFGAKIDVKISKNA
jgi:hypothetical protein